MHRPRNGEVYLGGENERSLSRFISGLVTFFCGLLIRQSGDAVSLRKVTACLTDVGREMRCPSVRHFVLALPLSVVRHLCSGATATGDVTAAAAV